MGFRIILEYINDEDKKKTKLLKTLNNAMNVEKDLQNSAGILF